LNLLALVVAIAHSKMSAVNQMSQLWIKRKGELK
jgi:hypothetical protein